MEVVLIGSQLLGHFSLVLSLTSILVTTRKPAGERSIARRDRLNDAFLL